MKRICMCNLKGGSGKSTTTLLLGMVLSSVGKSVAIQDFDTDQKTATKFLESFGNDLFEIYQEGKEYDILIYDNEPKLDEPLRETLRNSDHAYITSSPSPPEIYSVLDTVAFLDKEFPDLPRNIIFNRIQGQNNLSKLRFEILQKMQEKFLADTGKHVEITALKSAIPYSVKYQEIFITGEKSLGTAQLKHITQLALEIL